MAKLKAWFSASACKEGTNLKIVMDAQQRLYAATSISETKPQEDAKLAKSGYLTVLVQDGVLTEAGTKYLSTPSVKDCMKGLKAGQEVQALLNKTSNLSSIHIARKGIEVERIVTKIAPEVGATPAHMSYAFHGRVLGRS